MLGMLMANPFSTVSPTTLEEGLVLPGKNWTVIERIHRAVDSTGGNYSIGYKVLDKAGRPGFLKVYDFSSVKNSPDPALMLQSLVNAYVHEREILKICGTRHLDRIIRVIDSGKIDAPSEPGGMIFYLVLEQATCDAREFMGGVRSLDMAWRLRTLHQITVALHQLHSIDIAHQDLKPSNVLTFGNHSAKVGDLGRACSLQAEPPHKDEIIAGDPDYAPPESLYAYVGFRLEATSFRLRFCTCSEAWLLISSQIRLQLISL